MTGTMNSEQKIINHEDRRIMIDNKTFGRIWKENCAWKCGSISSDTSTHATLDDAKAAMFDLLIAESRDRE